MTNKKYHTVAVLLGGTSQERDVSLVSGQGAYKALLNQGYDAYMLDTGNPDWVSQLIQKRPDAALNMLHGRFGEDGITQGVLESLNIPYSHSGVMASAIAMDKVHTKTILEKHDLPVPPGFFAKPCDIYAMMQEKIAGQVLNFPVVVKPVNEGSSFGIIVAHDLDSLKLENFPQDMQHYEYLMVEKFIAGREMTVSVFQDKPMAVTEIIMPDDFYDYKAKYNKGGSRHVIPANIPLPYYDLMMEYARQAHKIIGCKGISRTDFRYEVGDSPAIYILEINTQPGMTPTSLLPEQAEFCNISYDQLVARMVEDASCSR